MSTGDLPLPIADDQPASAWPVQQQPTSLIVLWPGDQPPTMTEVIAALSDQCEAPPALMQEMPARPGVPWAAAFATSLLDAPLIMWIEPAQPLAERELDDQRAYACKWVLGVETMLSTDQAYEDYVAILSALASAFEPPAILDTVTGRWLELEALSDLAHAPPGQPPPDALWVIHSIFDPNDPNRGHWLHTHGLWRCGKPELEMLEVPAERASDAGRLLNNIARLTLDVDLPAPGELMPIGPELDITLHYWKALMGQLAREAHGGPDDRAGDDNPHRGMRAVICGPQPRGVFRKQWTWPSEAVERVSQDRAVIYHSDRETQRAAKLARQRWDELATAFAAMVKHGPGQPPRAVFTIKAAFTHGGHAEHREHMWIEVREFKADSATGELINQPLRLAHLRQGDIVTIGRDDVSDWQVFTPAGSFAPTDVPALWRTLDVLKDPSRGELADRRRSLRGVPRALAQERSS
jgi:uncharacterized protein YegJ (DUF2314 family)